MGCNLKLIKEDCEANGMEKKKQGDRAAASGPNVRVTSMFPVKITHYGERHTLHFGPQPLGQLQAVRQTNTPRISLIKNMHFFPLIFC